MAILPKPVGDSKIYSPDVVQLRKVIRCLPWQLMNGNNNSAGETFPNPCHSASSARQTWWLTTYRSPWDQRQSVRPAKGPYLLCEGVSVPSKVALFTWKICTEEWATIWQSRGWGELTHLRKEPKHEVTAQDRKPDVQNLLVLFWMYPWMNGVR